MVTRVIAKKGIYRDSITLMQISTALGKLPGVSQAAAVMATELNRRVLFEAGFSGVEIAKAARDDMVVAVEAKDKHALDSAFDQAEKLLASQGGRPAGEKAAPTSLGAALQEVPDANFALISVPGQFAKREAAQALARGLNVFLFSSNVSLDEEVALKKTAEAKGLLMMGPDCGTSIINHKVFGFGNVVREGGIGIVSASGTGLQEVSTLIDRSGLGISQAIGTGAGDMSERVGGITMARGISLLEEDPNTKILVLISKPPSPVIAAKVLGFARNCKKPVVVNFLGAAVGKEGLGSAKAASTLEEAADLACAVSEGKVDPPSPKKLPQELASAAKEEWNRLSPRQRYVRGLFAGGTLCYESQVILGTMFGRIYSNGPIRQEDKIPGEGPSKMNSCIDMGAEEFVEGRLHPMIDFSLRNARILKEAADPETAVLLLDVELGFGSNPDPAGELVPSITQAKALAARQSSYLSVVAHIVATEADHQGLKNQEERLRAAGVLLAPSNASASRLAALIASRGTKPGGVG